MRNLRTNRSAARLAGFILIENLVAIVLFTVGAVGIAVSTAGAIKINTDNQARAMAVAAATAVMEPVTAESWKATTNGQLITMIRDYVATDAVPAGGNTPAVPAYAGETAYGNYAAGASESFTVSVVEAVDAAGTNVLTAAGPYVSPVTVAVLVLYAGNSGRTNAAGDLEISNIKQARASFTYVIPD